MRDVSAAVGHTARGAGWGLGLHSLVDLRPAVFQHVHLAEHAHVGQLEQHHRRQRRLRRVSTSSPAGVHGGRRTRQPEMNLGASWMKCESTRYTAHMLRAAGASRHQ